VRKCVSEYVYNNSVYMRICVCVYMCAISYFAQERASAVSSLARTLDIILKEIEVFLSVNYFVQIHYLMMKFFISSSTPLNLARIHTHESVLSGPAPEEPMQGDLKECSTQLPPIVLSPFGGREKREGLCVRVRPPHIEVVMLEMVSGKNRRKLCQQRKSHG